jgi:ABC-type polysaccharide transport system permease subunit
MIGAQVTVFSLFSHETIVYLPHFLSVLIIITAYVILSVCLSKEESEFKRKIKYRCKEKDEMKRAC